MTRLAVVIDVPDVIDPALTDPEMEVGEPMVDVFNEWARANDKGEPVTLVSAEWEV